MLRVQQNIKAEIKWNKKIRAQKAEKVTSKDSPHGTLQRTKMYCAHPYSGYKRGTSENINKMLDTLYKKEKIFKSI